MKFENQQAYNIWAKQYDTNVNKTRDLEAHALQKVLENQHFEHVLEIGCGTGKNTEYFLSRRAHVTGVDFSSEMLEKAKQKFEQKNVEFIETDITKKWNFTNKKYDLVTCSLVLEHIENIDFVFSQAFEALDTGGGLYVGEFHPFRQYQGRKARFETENGVFELECFIHHVSEFMQAAQKSGFKIQQLDEWFDNDDRQTLPRILSLFFKK